MVYGARNPRPDPGPVMIARAVGVLDENLARTAPRSTTPAALIATSVTPALIASSLTGLACQPFGQRQIPTFSPSGENQSANTVVATIGIEIQAIGCCKTSELNPT